MTESGVKLGHIGAVLFRHPRCMSESLILTCGIYWHGCLHRQVSRVWVSVRMHFVLKGRKGVGNNCLFRATYAVRRWHETRKRSFFLECLKTVFQWHFCLMLQNYGKTARCARLLQFCDVSRWVQVSLFFLLSKGLLHGVWGSHEGSQLGCTRFMRQKICDWQEVLRT